MNAMWMPDSPILRLWWLKRLSGGGGGEKIEVTWNQMLPELTDVNVAPANANNIAMSYDAVTREFTQEWLKVGQSYSYAIRTADQNVETSHIYYVSYMCFPEFERGRFGFEFTKQVDDVNGEEVAANTWHHIRNTVQSGVTGGKYYYFGYLRSTASSIGLQIGAKCKTKNCLIVDLTQMYGAGNEPTPEEFERQCSLNGIDLTQSQPQDNGTVRQWRV